MSQIHWSFEMQGEVGILTDRDGKNHVVYNKWAAGEIFCQILRIKPEEFKKGERKQWLAANLAMQDSEMPDFPKEG